MADQVSLNLDRLAECIGLDREDVADLLAVFCETAPAACEQLATALTASDIATACRAAHTIKGGAATVGLSEIASEAGEIERRLRPLREAPTERSALDGLDAKLQGLHNLITRTCAAFEAETPPS